MEEGSRNKEKLDNIKAEMSASTNKYDLTKDHPRIANKIQMVVAAKILNNPRLSIADTFAEEVAEHLEIEKEREEKKKKATELTRNASLGLVNSGGGMPNVDESKTYKTGDVASGDSKRAMEKFLAGMGG